MRKLLLLFVVSLASITLAEAQIIRSSRGVVKTNTVTVENEKPATHSNRWREIGAKTQTLALDIDVSHIYLRYQMEKRVNDVLSWGFGGTAGYITSVFGTVRVDLFPETLAKSRFMPYLGLAGGTGIDVTYGESLDLIVTPRVGFAITNKSYAFEMSLGLTHCVLDDMFYLPISLGIKF